MTATAQVALTPDVERPLVDEVRLPSAVVTLLRECLRQRLAQAPKDQRAPDSAVAPADETQYP